MPIDRKVATRIAELRGQLESIADDLRELEGELAAKSLSRK